MLKNIKKLIGVGLVAVTVSSTLFSIHLGPVVKTSFCAIGSGASVMGAYKSFKWAKSTDDALSQVIKTTNSENNDGVDSAVKGMAFLAYIPTVVPQVLLGTVLTGLGIFLGYKTIKRMKTVPHGILSES